MLAVRGRSTILVDCGGDVLQKALQAGVDLDSIELLLLTHEHADHVSGFPLFMEKIWLAGRRRPIPVAGPESALDQARAIFGAFNTSGWLGLPDVDWRPVRLEENARVFEDQEWRIVASPGQHSVPVVGFRITSLRDGGVLAYSADTEKVASIERLAREADILVHEATGGFRGHTSAVGAAETARDAGARRLVLVHLPPQQDAAEQRAAQAIFPELEIGRDGDSYAFGRD
jgi:ribonuclease Z